MPGKHVPIYSTKEDERDLRESINEFVVALAERVDALQDAEGEGNLRELRALAASLARDAERVGYLPLAGIATDVVQACAQGEPDVAQKALVALTDIGRRIRMGHRGAS